MTDADIQFRSDMTVDLVRSSASDSDVLFAARVSTQGEQTLESAQSGEEASGRDRGLVNFLMRDRHGSPFEHNSMTFYVQAPIFVFREFMRHRIASYNEESGRYRELRPVFYVPARERNLAVPANAEQLIGRERMSSFPATTSSSPWSTRPRVLRVCRRSRRISACWRPGSPARWRASCSR